MKKAPILLVVYLVLSYVIPGRAMADVEPLIGATLFGGAERGAAGKEVDANCTALGVNCSTHRVLGNTVGMGGFELLGVLPFSRQFGLQGSYGFTGQHDGYRLATSLGPLYSYGSGKLGLFVDYEFRKEPLGDIRPAIAFRRISENRYQNFIYLRGVWTHYFEKFDLLMSYTQPVHKIQESSATDWDNRRAPKCFPKKAYSINEFKGILRFYPTSQLEIDAGMLVNSFAGPDRNVTGTGVGGVVGVHYAITKNIVLNIAQAQGDSRSRFRATSGIQFFWSPGSSSDQKPKREDAKIAHVESMLLAGGGGTHGNCL